MSYLVSFQLKKIMQMQQSLEQSEANAVDGGGSKSARGLAASAVLKFNNFFKQNLVKLLVEEDRRDQLVPEMIEAPKYSVCFSDLAEYLNLKDEVQKKVTNYDDEDKSVSSLQQYSYLQKTGEDRQTQVITEEPIAEATP